MKQIIYLLFGISSFIFTSCGPDNDPIDYPVTFSYKKKLFDKPNYFVVEASQNLNLINATGNFIKYEADMKETVEDFWAQDDNIKSVSLLSDKKAQIILFNGISQEVDYVKSGNALTVSLDADNQETLDLSIYDLPNNKQQVLLPISCHLYSYTLNNGQKDYSPFEVNITKNKALVTIAKELVLQKKLKTNDTIAVNVAQIVYE